MNGSENTIMRVEKRNSDKIMRLRSKHGLPGYAVYMMIKEKMQESEQYVLDADYDLLAFEFMADVSLVKSVIEDFDLFSFTTDHTMFYCPNLLTASVMEKKRKEEISRKRSLAAQTRWSKERLKKGENSRFNAKNMQNDASALQKRSNIIYNKDFNYSSNVDNAKPSSTASAKKKEKLSLEEEINEMKKDTVWMESIKKKFSLSDGEMMENLSAFRLSCCCKGLLHHSDIQDAKSHVYNWLNYQNKLETGKKERDAVTGERKKDIFADPTSATAFLLEDFSNKDYHTSFV